MKFIPLAAGVAALPLAACSNESELPQDDQADTATMPEQDAMTGADPAAMMPTIGTEYIAAAGASDLTCDRIVAPGSRKIRKRRNPRIRPDDDRPTDRR